jgi:hypothetical protein
VAPPTLANMPPAVPADASPAATVPVELSLRVRVADNDWIELVDGTASLSSVEAFREEIATTLRATADAIEQGPDA